MCYCLCATAYKLVNNWPCNWTWVPLPAHKPRLNMLCPEISLLGGLCKISHLCATAYKLVNNWPCNWKWVPLPAHKPRLNMFCPEISLLGGLCKISHLCAVTYVLLLTSLWTTDPAIGNGCHYLPTSLVWTFFAQKSPYWGACVKSVTCEQMTLQLEMGATTCPQASSEHVLPRNLLTGGLV